MISAKLTKSEDVYREIYSLHRKTNKTSLYIRTQMVLLTWKGYNIKEIAYKTGVCKATVKRWIKRYNQNGINGLV